MSVNSNPGSGPRSKLRIGIDNISPGLSTTRSTLGGMRHWMQALIDRLPRAGGAHEFEVFSPKWSDPFENHFAPNVMCLLRPAVPKIRFLRAIYEQLWLPLQIRGRRLSLWIGTSNTLPLFAPCRTVLIVQSMQYVAFPEAYGWIRRMYLNTLLRLSLRRADAVVVFSEATKNQIARRFAIGEEKIRVIPHACRFLDDQTVASPDEERTVLEKTGGPYVLSVSAFYGYKNLYRLIEAYARLDRPLTHKLILAGAPTKRITIDDIRAKAREHGVSEDVICLGRVSDDELRTLYRHATLMAMPSLEETFGLPVLEAMSLGCPVVTSNCSSMPEIGGDAAVLVDPHDVESVASGLRRVLADADLRRDMSERGMRRARSFTQERFCNQLMDVIQTAAGAVSD
jgi:glycosyltransferase involved in cell wall biosynthesis